MSPRLTTLRAAVTLSILWVGLFAHAQKTADHESISTAQGLSQGMIFSMLQDKEGFIWIGTKEGLNRYDGYNFKIFTNDPYNPHSISSNTIISLFEDSKGRIWAGTQDAGMNVYDKKTGEFRRIMHQPGDRNSLSANRILSGTIELADGRMLVTPKGNILNIISLPDGFFEKDITPTISHITIPDSSQIFGVGRDDKGKIWVGNIGKRIYLFDPSNAGFELLSDGKTFTSVLSKTGTKMWGNHIVLKTDTFRVYRPFDTTAQLVPGKVSRNADGNIELSFLGEVTPGIGHTLLYDMRNWSPGMPVDDAQRYSFASSLIKLQSIMVDRSGILWAGTSGFGLNKYNIGSNRFHHLFPNFSVRNMVPLGNDKLFLGGWQYDRWVTTNGVSLKNPLPQELGANSYINFFFSRKGECWVWKQSILSRHDKNGKKIAEFPLSLKDYDEKQPMLEDRSGNIWVCGVSGLLVRINPTSGKISQFSISNDAGKPMLSEALSTAFYEDEGGIFWMGTEDGFVRIEFRDNNENPSIRWYRNNAASSNSLNYNYVSCLLDDPSDKNYLWICTKGGGLNRLEKSTGNFIHITTKQGLPNDVVYGILPDSSGNLWGSTNSGIFCLFPGKNKDDQNWVLRNFSKSDGLQGDEFNTNAFLKLANGDLAFGGVNGLNIFNPAEVLSAGYKPNVFITNILIGNQPVTPRDKTGVLEQTIEQTKSITLTHLQDIVTLEFSSLDFTAPLQNKYRYQLIGVDDRLG